MTKSREKANFEEDEWGWEASESTDLAQDAKKSTAEPFDNISRPSVLKHDAAIEADDPWGDGDVDDSLLSLSGDGDDDAADGFSQSPPDHYRERSTFSDARSRLRSYLSFLADGSGAAAIRRYDERLRSACTPSCCREMTEYYASRPHLGKYTADTEIGRLKYIILPEGGAAGGGTVAAITEDDAVREEYYRGVGSRSLERELLWRAGNQSVLADVILHLTSQAGPIVPSLGMTAMAKSVSFLLDFESVRLEARATLSVSIPSEDGRILLSELDIRVTYEPCGPSLAMAVEKIILVPLSKHDMDLAVAVCEERLMEEETFSNDDNAIDGRGTAPTVVTSFGRRDSMLRLHATAAARKAAGAAGGASTGFGAALRQLDVATGVSKKMGFLGSVVGSVKGSREPDIPRLSDALGHLMREEEGRGRDSNRENSSMLSDALGHLKGGGGRKDEIPRLSDALGRLRKDQGGGGVKEREEVTMMSDALSHLKPSGGNRDNFPPLSDALGSLRKERGGINRGEDSMPLDTLNNVKGIGIGKDDVPQLLDALCHPRKDHSTNRQEMPKITDALGHLQRFNGTNRDDIKPSDALDRLAHIEHGNVNTLRVGRSSSFPHAKEDTAYIVENSLDSLSPAMSGDHHRAVAIPPSASLTHKNFHLPSGDQIHSGDNDLGVSAIHTKLSSQERVNSSLTPQHSGDAHTTPAAAVAHVAKHVSKVSLQHPSDGIFVSCEGQHSPKDDSAQDAVFQEEQITHGAISGDVSTSQWFTAKNNDDGDTILSEKEMNDDRASLQIMASLRRRYKRETADYFRYRNLLA